MKRCQEAYQKKLAEEKAKAEEKAPKKPKIYASIKEKVVEDVEDKENEK
jgi:hypothetical protein